MDEQDPVTQTNRIQCLPVQCQTTCQQVSTSLTTMAVELKQGQCNCFIHATKQDRLFYEFFCKALYRMLVIFAPAHLRGHPWKGALRGNDCKPVKDWQMFVSFCWCCPLSSHKWRLWGNCTVVCMFPDTFTCGWGILSYLVLVRISTQVVQSVTDYKQGGCFSIHAQIRTDAPPVLKMD